ncbi:major facilitator superfamily domain-containing protein [Xylaria bambusicola]|uniref:major facilitator superfamily domain-containing protein n=1 Tax=Xylaria bambusicola TaxID=326684 RepID=UPI0020083DBC|nr:major facilitator superfamily domain-containing protein [Xylaria bambusicola]KAI0521788.1 major facilitator superfamily domain-containing protein [Xylaria bambusicola]
MEKPGDGPAPPKVANDDMVADSSHISDVGRASSSHDDAKSVHVVDTSGNVADVQQAVARGLQPPEIIMRLTPEERIKLEKHLVRKIDWRLLPMIIIMYILNYIDRNNIAAAKLAGLPEDLNLKGAEFQTAVSILFVGYLLMQVPSNLFLNKIGLPGIYLPACMAVWGVISASTAAVTNFGGLLAVRFFLGFVEAVYFPGCLYYLSCWYTRKELGLRTALLYSGALISGAFSGLIAAAVKANLDGARGYGAWQWLFIIEGVITVAVAFIALPILPNFPRTTKWLTEEERALAIWRLEEDVGEDDWAGGEQSMWEGAKLAFTDIKTYVLLLLLLGIVSSGGVTNFLPAVVKTLGYPPVETLLLTSPPYVLCVVTSSLNAWHADRTGERFWHITGSLCVALVGFIIAATTSGIGPRYFAIIIMIPGVYGAFVVSLAWISNTMPRPPAKRAAALSFINAVSNATSIYVSYLYQDWMAPQYVIAFGVNSGTTVLSIAAALTLRIMLTRLNKKLDQGIHVEGAINALPGQAAAHGFRFKV